MQWAGKQAAHSFHAPTTGESVMQKSFRTCALFFLMLFVLVPYALADNEATTDEVYNLTLKAFGVVENLGEESLPAFNDPKGEFVFKNTYVVVINCSTGRTVTHPFVLDKVKDIDMYKNYAWFAPMCEAGKAPSGQWVEYQWPKPGKKEPSRKISFVINVPNTPYSLVSGIYSDTVPVSELNASLK